MLSTQLKTKVYMFTVVNCLIWWFIVSPLITFCLNKVLLVVLAAVIVSAFVGSSWTVINEIKTPTILSATRETSQLYAKHQATRHIWQATMKTTEEAVIEIGNYFTTRVLKKLLYKLSKISFLDDHNRTWLDTLK